MAHDKETREKLIESAKKEFMEKGYNKASLRKICADAGVTTGALYFFFNDKADLYRAIVGETVDKLFLILEEHYKEEKIMLDSPNYDDTTDDHSDLAQEIIHHIYSNYEASIMLLKKSQGSEYENIVERIVEMTENDSLITMQKYSERTGKKKKLNKYMLHLSIHLVVDSFVHLILHEPDEQKALANIKKVFKMTLHKWTDNVFD